ncbi:MAG TPA: ATP-binding protein [Oligoflexus sp.]|uniref:ATP-binding protein n=1 Tax=Oligoflexus sp. TaxID=1971216 RepID=UPI002D7F6AA1|nr:ATP-binding protein [Oligoflexus sp.]HET9240959.1 ATP-binding protein [Oligoflexus sp.]
MKKFRAVRRPLPRSPSPFQAISGQKELRDEVKRRYDRYRELVEQSHEGIWRFELDEPIDIRLPVAQQIHQMLNHGYLAECNEAMARMYGYADRSELIGVRLNEFLIPEKEENQLYLQAFVRNDYKLSDVDSVEHDKYGRILHFRNNLIGIVKNQRLICAWGMQKDVTGEVKNREFLQRSEERLRMASDAGGIGIWEWDIPSNELFWSDRAKQIYGFSSDLPVRIDDYFRAIHPDDKEKASQLVRDALESRGDGQFRNEHRILVEGTVKWVIGRGEVFFNEQGQALRISGTVIDTTEQKRAEIKATQLRDAGLQLAQSITLEQLSEVIRDFAGQILKAHSICVYRGPESELELILAHAADEALDDHLQIARKAARGNPVFPQNERDRLCAIPVVLNQDLLGVISLEFQDPWTCTLDFQSFVLTFADQCAHAFERTRLYERERAARREAEAANQAKSRFLANMSHEIRTPLAAMIGFAELLAEETVNDEERTDCLQRIVRNGQLLAEMINDFLDLSKIESEKLEVEHIDFEVIPLVQEVISLLELKAQEKNLRLILAAAGHLPTFVHSDPTRLQQILINLLSNAIKFTDHGRIEIRMSSVRAEGGRAQLCFTVADTGMGIPEAQQARIFEPFLQADSSTTRRFGGTGLGLAVSRGLAQALGGDLQLVKSVVGEGSSFSFTIDVGNAAPRSEAAALPPSTLKELVPQELKGLRILVVDDNPDNRTYIGSFLTSAGAFIETAANGIQAVELATEHDYDIVLMDIQMPELDGVGAMRYLKSHDYGKPVLALTAHAMTGDREISLTAGFQDHLVKPIDRASLIQAVRKYTGGR